MLAHETARFEQVKYNPWAIETAMHSRGLTITELAQRTGLKKQIIQSLIKGDVEADEEQIQRLSFVLEYPKKFFEQWFESRIDWGENGHMSKSVPIAYEQYRIMNVSPETPKTLSFVPEYAKKDGLLF